MSKITFNDLPLNDTLQLAILNAGLSYPTDIQKKIIPAIIGNSDIIASAPTGTGKTAAYLLPLIHKFTENPKRPKPGNIRSLIITPTRELALQTNNFFLEFASNTNLKSSVIVGGSGLSPQMQDIKKGVDLLIATPGRLVELIQKNAIKFDALEYFVIDEVDRMLEMGFIQAIDEITMELPLDIQSLFFSATISTDTAKLAGRILSDPLTISISNSEEQLRLVDDTTYHTLFVDRGRKRKLLLWLLNDINYTKILIFTRTRSDAERVARDLEKANLTVAAIHGNRSNFEREQIVENFSSGKVNILVTTDLTSRGFDIPNLSHVVNFSIPGTVQSFLHRTGRTGRAGEKGEVFSFCDQFDRFKLFQIYSSLQTEPQPFPWQPFHSEKIMEMDIESAKAKSLLDRTTSGSKKNDSNKKSSISKKKSDMNSKISNPKKKKPLSKKQIEDKARQRREKRSKHPKKKKSIKRTGNRAGSKRN